VQLTPSEAVAGTSPPRLEAATGVAEGCLDRAVCAVCPLLPLSRGRLLGQAWWVSCGWSRGEGRIGKDESPAQPLPTIEAIAPARHPLRRHPM